MKLVATALSYEAKRWKGRPDLHNVEWGCLMDRRVLHTMQDSSPGCDTSTDADGSVDRGNTAPSVEVGEVRVVSGATSQANDGGVLVLSGSMGGGDEGEESWPDMASSNG
jgi:hypothetical protein